MTAATPDAKPPSSIGPYEILERIGAGAAAEVFLAQQRAPLRRQVALKLCKPGHDSSEVVARFERERQALARMAHESIAQVFAAGRTPDGRPYFAMEYVPGLPITAYCERHRLPLEARLDLFVQLCRAVQHAHQKGVIHRDLKPSNILVTERGGRAMPMVIDFGIAKTLADASAPTGPRTPVGTPAYMSPEQAADAARVDTRTDVYSLGIVLDELLAGTRAGDLDCVLRKATAADREQRYATPHDLAADLGRFLRHQPVTARPPAAAYHLRKFVRRNPALAAGAGLAVAALLAGLVASQVFLLRARASESLEIEALGDARRARAEAEANLATALSAVDEMLARIGAEKTAHSPHLGAVTEDLLRRALVFYERVVAPPLEDPASPQLARARARIAWIRQRLGDAERPADEIAPDARKPR